MSKKILHRAVYGLIRAFIRPVIKRKYSFSTDYVPETGEPYIMLSNHTTEDDMLFTGTASRKHMYFVCGEHLLRNKLYGKPLRLLADPIPIPKGGSAVKAVIEILRRVRAGFNVCMFPEGKRSFHGETIPSAVSLGMLVKKAGCALVTYRITGGYFTYPRWARGHHRRGHVEGKVVGVYSSRQLAAMSAEEVTGIINRDTYENAYETQREKMWRYEGKDKAACMESLMFICPKCGKTDTIETSGDSFRCTACGMSGIYNDYGFLEGEDLPFDSVHSWMRWIEPRFDGFVSGHAAGETLYTENEVLLYRMNDGYRNEDVTTDTLTVCKDSFSIGEYIFPFSEISSLSILYGNILLFTHKGTYWGLTGESFRAWKCGRLWHLEKGDTNDRTKEM